MDTIHETVSDAPAPESWDQFFDAKAERKRQLTDKLIENLDPANQNTNQMRRCAIWLMTYCLSQLPIG